MGVAQKLDLLTSDNPGCRLAAFGDLGARLILCSSGEKAPRQEYFDEICDVSARNFEYQDALTGSMGHAAKPSGELFVVNPTETILVVRSDADDADMLVCVCNSPDDAWKLIPPARQFLADCLEIG